MVNKQLVDWIKSEEAQGYSERQLREYLLKQGYLKKDVDEAVKLSSETKINGFSLINYIKSISLPIIILFLASFIFLSYSFDTFKEGIYFLIILVAFAYIINLTYKKYKDRFVLYLILIFCMAVSFFHINALWIPIIVSLVLIHTLIYYFKSKQKYSLESLFLTFLMSIIFAITLAFVSYLIIAYGVFPLIGTISALTLNLILSPIILIFILSYQLILIGLLKKCFGKKGENINKSVIKTTLIIYVLFLLISLVTIAIIGVIYVDKAYSGISDTELETKTIYESSSRYLELAKLQEYDNLRISIFLVIDGRFIHSKWEFEDVGMIFYDCDINLNCKNKSFNPETRLEDQVSLKGSYDWEGRGKLIIAEVPEKTIFILPQESFEEAIMHNVFEFEDQELRDTRIGKELNAEFYYIYKQIIDRHTEMPLNWQQKLSYFHSGRVYLDLANNLWVFVMSNFDIYYIHDSIKITLEEYKWIKSNKINNSSFYDGTQTVAEHMQNLQNNIEQVYLQLPKTIDKDKNEYLFRMWDPFNLYPGKYSPLFNKANVNVFNHLDIYNTMYEMGEFYFEMQNSYIINKIKDEYNKKDLSESDISKILRLKIIETKIAKQVIDKCRTDECKIEIFSLTKNPRFSSD